MTDAELEAIIRRARDEGALPTSHMTIRRVIVDPKAPGPLNDGQVHDVTPDQAVSSHLFTTDQRSLIGGEQGDLLL